MATSIRGTKACLWEEARIGRARFFEVGRLKGSCRKEASHCFQPEFKFVGYDRFSKPLLSFAQLARAAKTGVRRIKKPAATRETWASRRRVDIQSVVRLRGFSSEKTAEDSAQKAANQEPDQRTGTGGAESRPLRLIEKGWIRHWIDS